MMTNSIRSKLCLISSLTLIPLLMAGCSGDGTERFPLGKVTGKVTHKGQAVTSGTITLSPVAKPGAKLGGRPAICVIKPDGSFVASTYKEGDGATVGKMTVSFSPPAAPEAGPVPEGGHAESIPAPYAGLVPGMTEIEIKAGDNPALTVELTGP